MKELNIILAGKTAAGKSTLANQIAAMLKQAGFKNVRIDDAGQFTNPETLNVRLAAIKDVEIKIKTVQVTRALELN